MADQNSFSNINKHVFQLGLENFELSQKKTELTQQVKGCRADISERKSYIETTQTSIKKLEEDIKFKQNTLMQNKAAVKSMKTTYSLLLQYEQTLKAQLENRKERYNRDVSVYDERIASCRKTFQSHKEYYFQSPQAQKLLTLRAENEEIMNRLKVCDDQIKMRQKELDHLIDPEVSSFPTEELPDCVFGQQPVTEPEKEIDGVEKEDCNSTFDFSSLHLNQTMSDHQNYAEENAEEIEDESLVQDSSACQTSPQKSSEEPWPTQQLDEQCSQDELQFEEQEASQEDTILVEQESTILATSEVPEESEEEIPIGETREDLAVFTLTSTPPHPPNNQPVPAKTTAVTPSPTFTFGFSPTSSLPQSTPGAKPSSFLFSTNSEPSPTGFAGFGFEMGSSQEEDSPFAPAGSLFTQEKTTESKSSGCPDFLFGQPGESEDFQCPFSSESRLPANKQDDREEFPFSFKF